MKNVIKLFVPRFIKWIIRYMINLYKCPTLKCYAYATVKQSVLGKHITLYNDVYLNHCNIGDYTYIAEKSIFSNTTIGKFCSIGPGIRCGLGMHPTKSFVSTHPIFFSPLKQTGISYADKSYFYELAAISIGNDVWIGANAVILDGVTIGNGAIIAAGAVVNKNIPPYAIVGGVPAKIIRYRFDDSKIKFLLNDAWWNKPDEWIKDNYLKFHNIYEYEAFVKRE